jgi:transposase
MGRSRGGLTTKIHALVDANGNPIALKLTEGDLPRRYHSVAT